MYLKGYFLFCVTTRENIDRPLPVLVECIFSHMNCDTWQIQFLSSPFQILESDFWNSLEDIAI